MSSPYNPNQPVTANQKAFHALEEMDYHEAIFTVVDAASTWMIVRVPNGWIYTLISEGKERTSTFVPRYSS